MPKYQCIPCLAKDYYDDIIWDSQKYNVFAKYIIDNPLKWVTKKYY